MHIQFDREDSESLAGFTFDNSELDQEQMTDFLLWLQSLNLSYNKLKLRSHTGSSEKVTCIIVKQPIPTQLPVQQVTLLQPFLPPSPPVSTLSENIQETLQTQQQQVKDNTVSDDDSESETESDTLSKTKKTTKKVVKK
jgi:hypothetical protein